MSLADEIRAFTFSRYIAPQLEETGTASVTCGEVHTAMGFHDRVPAVCGALNTKIFETEYNLRLLERLGRPVSTRTRFVFTSSDEGGSKLSADHLARLKWFEEHTGEIVNWAVLGSPEQRLASIPKGIYRPAGWRHALSIKVIPHGRYPDAEATSDDGGVRIRYHQEEPSNAEAREYFTNVGLKNCLLDAVPVGVIRQVKPKPNPQYEVVGLGTIIDWRDGFFSVGLGPGSNAVDARGEPREPISLEDARRRTLRAIVQRRGQAKFRRNVLEAYEGRCAISDCDVTEVLEAAHIKPFLGNHTNVVTNGLPLRSDLHTLFDLRLVRINPATLTVWVDPQVTSSTYRKFHGHPLRPPRDPGDAPAPDALEFQWTDQVELNETEPL